MGILTLSLSLEISAFKSELSGFASSLLSGHEQFGTSFSSGWGSAASDGNDFVQLSDVARLSTCSLCCAGFKVTNS